LPFGRVHCGYQGQYAGAHVRFHLYTPIAFSSGHTISLCFTNTGTVAIAITHTDDHTHTRSHTYPNFDTYPDTNALSAWATKQVGHFHDAF